jgi:hypothetical protein
MIHETDSDTPHEVMAHKQVALVAVAIANDLYEANASNDEFYKINPDRVTWVRRMCGLLIDDAREALALVAKAPDTPMEEKLRIYEALILDEQLPGAAKRVETVTQRALVSQMRQELRIRGMLN